MITLNQIDKEKLQAALDRAKDAELKITPLYQSKAGGHYIVDSDHSRHHVYIWQEEKGAAYECDCTAHKERKLICRCAAGALEAHKAWLEMAIRAENLVMLADGGTELFGCLGRNCRNEVEERDVLCAVCLDRELDLSMTYSDVYKD